MTEEFKLRARAGRRFEDEYYVEPLDDEHRSQVAGRDLAAVFAYIYRHNAWEGGESAAGEGSDLAATLAVRSALPGLLRKWRIRSILDLPCGDAGWLRSLPLGEIGYLGGDIVEEIVARNRAACPPGQGPRFEVLDLVKDELPAADLLVCRDCLVHLPLSQASEALRNIARSGCKYLLATTFLGLGRNVDIEPGDWRPLNLRLPPFGLPEPLDVIVEVDVAAIGGLPAKALGLWDIDSFRER
ncbi:class I SAM-dependent methyltransferase [Amycolatopsis sp. cg5]|uniref:class I SAM-dependent methyltransferase n=1 Tax=Amycolatopsis sp. cg5 TaxID=3238802 RepID=UPI003525F5FF